MPSSQVSHAARAVAAVVLVSSLAPFGAASAIRPAAAHRTTRTREAVLGAISAGVEQLYTYYDPATGFFGNASGGPPFWTTANAVETLANALALSPGAGGGGGAGPSPLPTFENTFLKMKPLYCRASPKGTCWMDDHLWWVLAWARVAEVTGNATYLEQAQEIFTHIVTDWGAVNQTCGGIEWELGNPYVNAIPNELFLSAAMRLSAQLTPGGGATVAGNMSVSQWAQWEAQWFFLRTPMPVAQPGGGLLVTDGLSTANCGLVNPSGAYWTYNQGVILSGLALLEAAGLTPPAPFPSPTATARTLAETSFAYFAAPGSGGSSSSSVMMERSCGGNGSCGGQDGKQFKGVFVRHLAYALPTLVSTSPDPSGTLELYAGWLANQTESILSLDALPVGGGQALLQFGQLWQGPFAWDPQPWVSQGSALDALIATAVALGMQMQQQQQQV